MHVLFAGEVGNRFEYVINLYNLLLFSDLSTSKLEEVQLKKCSK